MTSDRSIEQVLSKPVSSVAEYIESIQKIIEILDGKNGQTTYVYRGETKFYETHCQPNLFRNNYLENNPYFEKNLFGIMTANDTTTGDTYLEKAIDAQHGGFPSRLLDVSYNCLVALYFSVTPYYRKPENEADAEDGMVYIFPIDKMYCPTSKNIQDAYDAIVNRTDWIVSSGMCRRNHKLIDHITTNKRIIAQQGAFILFQGDTLTPIPPHRYYRLTVDCGAKRHIREDLKKLFGIHTGTIYPENENLVEEFVKKSNQAETYPYSLVNEVRMALKGLDEAMDRLVREIVECRGEYETCMEIVEAAEQELQGYLMDVEEILEFADEKEREEILRMYHRKVYQHIGEIRHYVNDRVEVSEHIFEIQ